MHHANYISGGRVFNASLDIFGGGARYGLVIFRDHTFSFVSFDRFYCPVRQSINKRDAL